MDDKRLERMEAKLDDMSEHLSSIDTTLMKQELSLTEHIKRTNLLEERVKPIENHMTELKGVVKVLKLLALLATIVEGLHYWRH
jgi:archaellum component FlaC